MAVAVLIEFPEGTTELYDRVMADLAMEELPEGGIAHVAAQTEDGLRILDVWESPEHFQRFHEEHLSGALERAGAPQPLPPKIGPVHNVMLSAEALSRS